MVPTVEIALTWAASDTPVSASSVTVAGWPTLTLLMSDSLKATFIAIELVLTISAKAELELPEDEEDEELEPPRLPAAVAPAEEPDEVPLPDVVDGDAAEVEPADTALPADRLESDTIVPLIGAYSLVLVSAVWALLTLASAL